MSSPKKRPPSSSTSRSKRSPQRRQKAGEDATRKPSTESVRGNPAASSTCVECGLRKATVRVTSSGMPCDPTLCERCHEVQCSREWRMYEWRQV